MRNVAREVYPAVTFAPAGVWELALPSRPIATRLEPGRTMIGLLGPPAALIGVAAVRVLCRAAAEHELSGLG